MVLGVDWAQLDILVQDLACGCHQQAAMIRVEIEIEGISPTYLVVDWTLAGAISRNTYTWCLHGA